MRKGDLNERDGHIRQGARLSRCLPLDGLRLPDEPLKVGAPGLLARSKQTQILLARSANGTPGIHDPGIEKKGYELPA
jgi:hypothetical protein